MKTTFLILTAMILSLHVFGQTTYGKITYDERAKPEIKFEGEAARYVDSFPKERVSYMVLYFNSDNSLYQVDDSKKSNEIMRTQKSHSSVRMIASGEFDKTFCDIKKRRIVEQKEFMTRIFLIEGNLSSHGWKFTGNSRTFLGYNCLEAVCNEGERKISAWFTSTIPISSGPAGYDGLPGMVLLVDIDSGRQTIRATSVDPSFNDPSKLKMPQEGKKVTHEEYNRIVEEKFDEIRNNNGSSGGGNRY